MASRFLGALGDRKWGMVFFVRRGRDRNLIAIPLFAVSLHEGIGTVVPINMLGARPAHFGDARRTTYRA
jgi:hypothetical protein